MKTVSESMEEAEQKAWDSLARYKFLMFGYHAAQWVTLNKLLPAPLPNPFRELVSIARVRCDGKADFLLKTPPALHQLPQDKPKLRNLGIDTP